jgi:hypothetical protein
LSTSTSTSRRSRRLPRFVAPAAALLASLLVAQSAMASVSWASARYATGGMRDSWGSALARTSTSERSRLHLVVESLKVDGRTVTDTGPYQAIEYRRSSDGLTWSSPRRLNAIGKHGDFPAIAAAGSRVYVVWRQTTHIQDWFINADPRVLRIAINDDHGDPADWRPRKALTTSGRVDRPSIAATGKRVFVTYTDVSTGEIRVLRSGDRGHTWSTPKAIGATVSQPFGPAGDYWGQPVVAASGLNVVVAFLSDNGINLRRSIDGGKTWTSFVPTNAQTYGYAVAASGDRIALAYVDATGGYTRVRKPGGWQDWKQFEAFGPTEAFYEPHSYTYGWQAPGLALPGTTGLAVAWSACTDQGCPASSTQGSSLRFRESTTNGSTWKRAKTVGAYGATSARRWNESPSLVMAGTRTRFVAWIASAPGTSPRAMVRKGVGAP